MEKQNSKIVEYLEKIEVILEKILNLSNNADIEEFSKLVADFNAELNFILSKYHEDQDIQPKLKPYIMFYRQIFQEFMTIASNDSIPEEKFEQIKTILNQRKELINDYYIARAEIEKKNMVNVSVKLEKCLQKRLEMKEILEKQKKLDHYS